MACIGPAPPERQWTGALLELSGDSGRAAEIAEPMLTAGADRDRNDMWSNYLLAYLLVGGLIFDELRAEVQH